MIASALYLAGAAFCGVYMIQKFLFVIVILPFSITVTNGQNSNVVGRVENRETDRTQTIKLFVTFLNAPRYNAV
jgi:hypothetical protein